MALVKKFSFKPLAAYVFSNSSSAIERVKNETHSGGLCVNDLILHMVVPDLPFGGVGPSGTGAYLGKASFTCFSHEKSVLVRAQNMEGLMSLRYPPYSKSKTDWLTRLSGHIPSCGLVSYVVGKLPFILLGAGLTIALQKYFLA